MNLQNPNGLSQGTYHLPSSKTGKPANEKLQRVSLTGLDNSIQYGWWFMRQSVDGTKFCTGKLTLWSLFKCDTTDPF